MTQEEINALKDFAEVLYEASYLLEDEGDNIMYEALEAQFHLDSLVHFCQTGKFLEYVKLDCNQMP